jgi:aminopeptidase YwaD
LIAIAAMTAAPVQAQTTTVEACARCIRADMEFLASDAMHGRGSGTHDEQVTATYVGSQLERSGIAPAGDNGTYVQTATIVNRSAATPPVMSFSQNGTQTRWMHGEQILVLGMPSEQVSGPLQKLKNFSDPIKKGSMVLAPAGAGPDTMGGALQAGPAMLLAPAPPQVEQRWARMAKRLPRLGSSAMGTNSIMMLNQQAAAALAQLPDGTLITVTTQPGPEKRQQTWNAVGILRGSDPTESKEVVLLTAHLDHLGIGAPVDGDDIYNGADDDASGTTAVLEMARVLGSGEAPKRTVVFAVFGSEEKGGLGSNWFLQHPPVPLLTIVANLEFEMIGRPDPAVKPDELWLTGWDRSNLGPALAQHGAKLVDDPHPAENFFERSDNIVLAKKGVVAQTVSSFGLHPQYHRPSDDLAHIDWKHMEQAIGSVIAPVQWLVNSDFKPEWLPGKKP